MQTFYETWYGLMGFVNERMGVIKAKIKPEYPNSVSDMMVHKVREVLWAKPELIDEYISKTELPQKKIDILKLWRTNHKKGMFFILEYQPQYAVAIVPNEQGEDRLYATIQPFMWLNHLERVIWALQARTILFITTH